VNCNKGRFCSEALFLFPIRIFMLCQYVIAHTYRPNSILFQGIKTDFTIQYFQKLLVPYPSIFSTNPVRLGNLVTFSATNRTNALQCNTRNKRIAMQYTKQTYCKAIHETNALQSNTWNKRIATQYIKQTGVDVALQHVALLQPFSPYDLWSRQVFPVFCLCNRFMAFWYIWSLQPWFAWYYYYSVVLRN